MSGQIIPGTGYNTRPDTASPQVGAVPASTLPLYIQNMVPSQWKRLDNTSMQVTPWCPTFNFWTYHMDLDKRYRLNVPADHTSWGFPVGLILGQAGLVMRQKSSIILGMGGGHGITAANPLYGIQLNQASDAYGTNIKWFEIDPCTDYNLGFGPVGATYADDGTPIHNPGTLLTPGTPSTSYFFQTGSDPSGNARVAQAWDRTQRPMVGHTGYGQFFDDKRDLYYKFQQGNNVFAAGGATKIDIYNYQTKQWDPKNTNGSSDPLNWTSNQPDWATAFPGAQPNLFYTTCFGDPNTGDLFKLVSDRFARWRVASNTILWPWGPGLSSPQNSFSYPTAVIPSQNLACYFDVLPPFTQLATTFILRIIDIPTGTQVNTFVIPGISFQGPQPVPQEAAFYHPKLDCLVYITLNPGVDGLFLINYRTGAVRQISIADAVDINGNDIGAPGKQGSGSAQVREGSFRSGYSTELDVVWLVSSYPRDTPLVGTSNDALGTCWLVNISNQTPP